MTEPAPPPAAPRALLIHPNDDVVVVTGPVAAGERLEVAGMVLVAPRELKLGAKLARRVIAAGAPVRKYGEPIGSASADIAAGDYVHTHNLRSDYLGHRGAEGGGA